MGNVRETQALELPRRLHRHVQSQPGAHAILSACEVELLVPGMGCRCRRRRRSKVGGLEGRAEGGDGEGWARTVVEGHG